MSDTNKGLETGKNVDCKLLHIDPFGLDSKGVEYTKTCLIALVFVFTVCVLARLVTLRADVPQTDFFQFWAAGHIVSSGGNPYDMAMWLSVHEAYSARVMDPQFIYPLPLAILLAPIGWLNPTSAYMIWMQLSVCMIAMAMLCLSARAQHDIKMIFPLLVCGLFFHPALANLMMGHTGGLLLLAVAVSVHCWQRDRWWGGGLALSLLAIKPGLGLPIMALVGVWIIARHNWSALAAICVGCSALLLVGMIYDPGWILKFVHIIYLKSSCFGRIAGMATCYGQPSVVGMGWVGIALAIILIGAFFVANIQSYRCAIGMAVPVGLVLAPYVWTYDYILLLAPMLLLLGRMRISRAIIALLVIDLAAAGMAVVSAYVNIVLLITILPLCVYIVGISDILLKRKSFLCHTRRCYE
jgi:hypothetical protein